MRLDYFADLASFVDFVSPDSLRAATGGTSYVLGGGIDNTSLEWAGGLTYRQCIEQSRAGNFADPFAMELREKMLKSVRLCKDSQTKWDVAGGSVDVGAYNTGVPECMLSYSDEVGRSRKTVSLLLSVGGHCGLEPSTLRARGAAYMALVDALEMSGQYKTQVYAVAGNGTSYDGVRAKHGVAIQLKTAGHDYDPSEMGFALSHPGFFRQLTFAYWDTVVYGGRSEYSWMSSPGYGYCAEVSGLPESIDTDCIDCTAKMHTNDIRSTADGIKWVEKQLREFHILEEAGLR